MTRLVRMQSCTFLMQGQILSYYCRDRDVLLVVSDDIMYVVFLHRHAVPQQLGHSIFGGQLRPYSKLCRDRSQMEDIRTTTCNLQSEEGSMILL